MSIPTASDPDNDRSPRLVRYDRYAAVLIATVVIVLIAVAATGDGASAPAGRLGGDYPAFYGAGSIVLDGDIDSLYDPLRQQRAQEGLLEDGGFLFFAYPPTVAAAYAPLAALPYRVGFVLHTLVMLSALLGAVWLLRPLVPMIDKAPRIAALTAFGFYPMLRAVTGGQNTSLTALLFVAALRFEHDDRPFLAGVAAALLLYKPQFGIPLGILVLLRRRSRLAAGWTTGAVGFYLTGAALSGFAWPGPWWRDAATFAEQNEGVNGFLFVSLPGMVANVLGSGSGAGRVLWLAAGVLASALVAVAWFAVRDPLRRWGLTALALVLLLPQALYYEVGLALLALVAVAASPVAILVIWCLSWTQVLADTLDWSPLGIVAPVTMVWALRRTMTLSPKTQTATKHTATAAATTRET